MNPSDRKNASAKVANDVGPARGVLKAANPPEGQFQHWRLAPPATIAPLVQHIWMVRWSFAGGASHIAQTLPHPNVHLVVEAGKAEVHGIHVAKFARKLQGSGSVLGVKFRPGGFRPFLQKSVASLRNRSVTAQSILGHSAHDLAQKLGALELDASEAGAMVESFLLRHWPGEDPKVDRVAKIVHDIEADRAIRRVEDLVQRYALTKRSLQRLFEEYVGIGPKWVINRFRMHEAIERLNVCEPIDWAAFALELGYFDQAHFNRDFKALIGCTPKRYAVGS